MKLRIGTQQLQKTILAPSMQQSIEVLLLPLLELNTAVEQELQNNPLLEVEETRVESPTISSAEELRKKLEAANYDQGLSYVGYTLDDEIVEERPIKKDTCLEDVLLQQLRIEFSDPMSIKIGEFIIGNLDEDGYLQISSEEIAQLAGAGDLELVEAVLSTIKDFDPIGVASRNLKECLLSQAKIRYNGTGHLIYEILTNHLEDLGSKKYHFIAKKLKVSDDEVRTAAKIIATFEPKPARNYRPIDTSLYITPDIFITKNDKNECAVHINEQSIPKLRISSFYRKMLSKPNLNDQEREFITEKLRNAVQFIKSIAQRGQTIRQISEFILKKQKNFFTEEEAFLVPLTLKDVAQAIERNESTVSRAISNKYIDTPKGTYPLKFFFSQGFNENSNGGSIASRSIKEEIKDLIEQENKRSPLSDQDIQKHFEKRNMKIARRTINKYRKTLRILPSHLRKE